MQQPPRIGVEGGAALEQLIVGFLCLLGALATGLLIDRILKTPRIRKLRERLLQKLPDVPTEVLEDQGRNVGLRDAEVAAQPQQRNPGFPWEGAGSIASVLLATPLLNSEFKAFHASGRENSLVLQMLAVCLVAFGLGLTLSALRHGGRANRACGAVSIILAVVFWLGSAL